MSDNDKEKKRLQKEWENAAKTRDTLTMRQVQEKMNALLLKEGRKDSDA